VTIDLENRPRPALARLLASLRSSWRARRDADVARAAAQSLPRFVLGQALPWALGTLSGVQILQDWGGRDWKIALVVVWALLTLEIVRTAVQRHRARARLRVFPVRGPDG
jgi:hypothetical protein